MNLEQKLLTSGERRILPYTALHRQQLEEQFSDLEQQHHVAATAMWVFLATEVMFFGTLFATLGVYRYWFGPAFEAASEKLNWIIGGLNTFVLLVSSGTIVLAVHYAQHGRSRAVYKMLLATAVLGALFLVLKATEYYTDYRENLIPGWKFDPQEWLDAGLTSGQIPQVKLFLLFYWIMTAFHALHVTIGIVAVLIIAALARKEYFSPVYYAPVDVLALYWHFVDIVWIFLLPMLYLMSTHTGHRLGL